MITRHSVERAAFPVMKLGEAVDFLDSRRRPVTESERKAGPYPYYGANGIQGTIDTFIFDESLILLAEDGGHFDEPDRGVAYRISGKTWVNNHAHVLRPKAHLDMAYLCRVLENYDLSPFVSGTTRGKLTKAGACEIPIPVPPLPEQRRIADILDRADTLRAKRRDALARLDELTQAIFFEMFGDRGNFQSVRLEDISQRVTDGTHLTPHFQETGVPFIFVKNIKNGKIDFQTDKFISESERADLFRRCPIEPGDVLYTTVGATYGQAAPVGDFTKFAFQRHLAHIKPNKQRVIPRYLANVMQLPVVKRQADKWARGAAQPTINLKELRDFLIPLPTIAEQTKYVERIEQIDRMIFPLRDSLIQLDALFASLQDRAFRGAL